MGPYSAIESYSELDTEPIYNMKAVVEATGITAATLRAWERRYGALSPGRTGSGYRLYSSRDIAVLRWLKARIDEGMTISQAFNLLTHPRQTKPAAKVESQIGDGERGIPGTRDALLQALVHYDEAAADRIMGEAFAIYGVEPVTELVLAPALVHIGDLWHEGKATTAAEHFATNYLRRKLDAIVNAASQPHTGPLVVLGCGPGDWHELGLLLIHLMLRRRNVNTIYLGQNVPLAQFVEEMERLRPALIIMAATTAETIAGLIEMAAAVQNMSAPRPLFAFGGRIFNVRPELRTRVPGIFLGDNVREAVITIMSLIRGVPATERKPVLRISRKDRPQAE